MVDYKTLLKDVRLDWRVGMDTRFVHIMAVRFGRRRLMALTNVSFIVRYASVHRSHLVHCIQLVFFFVTVTLRLCGQQIFFSHFLVSDIM
jgi:hypothetical protein